VGFSALQMSGQYSRVCIVSDGAIPCNWQFATKRERKQEKFYLSKATNLTIASRTQEPRGEKDTMRVQRSSM